MEKAKVYFTKEITPESLIRIYEALGRELHGKTAVKISTGEPGGHNFLKPELIGPLVKKLEGTIVECNTAYEGRRNTSEAHWQTFKDHGFAAIAPCDLMDEEGELVLPVQNGKQLKENYVGSHLARYDSMLVLSHFKGHAMGGFGGALKNVAIGIASSAGKTYIHTAGKTNDVDSIWNNIAPQDDFLESMGEACKAVFDYAGDDILFINVANNLSVDCDCDGDPEAPKMGDIGILASLDPVALDRACVDLVVNSEDPGKADLIERMESRHATHLLDYSEQLGLGSQKYKLVEL